MCVRSQAGQPPAIPASPRDALQDESAAIQQLSRQWTDQAERVHEITQRLASQAPCLAHKVGRSPSLLPFRACCRASRGLVRPDETSSTVGGMEYWCVWAAA